MSSHRANEVRQRGLDDEVTFTNGLKLEPPIPGTDKNDARFRNGKTISLKGGNRLQYQTISPYSEKLDKIDAGDRMRSMALLFRNIPAEVRWKPSLMNQRKEELATKQKAFAKFLNQDDNLLQFARQVLFMNKDGSYVDYLGIKEIDIPVYHVFHREDVAITIANYCNAVGSKGRGGDGIDYQKTIIKSKYTIIQNEIRKDTGNFNCIGDRHQMLNLLTSYVSSPKLAKDTKKIQVLSYGRAKRSLKI